MEINARSLAEKETIVESDITVLVPGIRPHHWKRLYESIGKSFSGKWDIIFISPYDLPPVLHELNLKNGNVLWIQDWGTPIRCQQLGLIAAKGDFITWAADDGYFLDNALNVSFDLLKGKDENTLVTGMYHEGNDKQNKKVMADWAYYQLKYHDGTNYEFIPNGCLLLNVGLVPRKLLIKYGGWDCQFEVCPMSHSDLSVRLTRGGVKFIKQDEIMFTCSHMSGHRGDHGPIHDAQIYYDEPLFKKIYSSKESIKRLKIDLNNWKKIPDRWERRFGPC